MSVIVDTNKDRSPQEGLDDGRNITSLYLQRQESDLEGDKFRKYMQNKDIFRNNRKRQIFKQAEKEVRPSDCFDIV